MSKIENFKYTIEEAFRDCFYIVPDYQREYVWTDKEVQLLLEDIGEQLNGNTTREYFIGTVLVAPTAERNHFEVIDGQQRLTTFFLLLCALRHHLRGEPQAAAIGNLISTSHTTADGDMRTTLKLDPRYENAGELTALIANACDTPAATRAAVQTSGIRSFGSLKNLLNAYETLHRVIGENYPDAASQRRFWGYLATNVVFIQISADVSAALKIFETINERGVGLNPMDLLKNLLFTHVDTKEFARLKTEWKKITAPLEKAGEKPLRFLRYFLMANYEIKNDRGDAVVREDEIYDWLTDKANATTVGYGDKPFDFVRKLTRNVELYLQFADGRGNDGQPSVAMGNLKHLSGGAFSLHYVLLLAASGLPRDEFDHFVTQLESFLFIFIFTKSPTRELERAFSPWADELRAIAAESDPVTRRRRLNEFYANRFQAGIAAKADLLTDNLRRYTLHSMQKYRTRYLLAKLTQHVDGAYKGLAMLGSLDDYRGIEIEHILPDKPTADLRAGFAAASPGLDYDTFKNRLGNLTLLEKPINIVAGNDFFTVKTPLYQKSGYYLTRSIAGLADVGGNTSITRINAKLAAFESWNAQTIDQRQLLLIQLVGDIWKVTSLA